MSIPSGAQDLVGNLVLGTTDLGIAATVGSDATSGGVNNILTPNPGTVTLISKLTSGAGTYKVSVNAGTPSFGSPTASLSASGTGLQVVQFVTTTAAPYYSVEFTDTAGGSVIADLVCLDLVKLAAGEDWVNVRSGRNAVTTTINQTGSGVFSVAIA